MSETLARRYYPPNVGHVLQADYLRSVVETLQMSYLATVVGIALAIPLAWFASFNMTPSRRFLYPVARLAIMGIGLYGVIGVHNEGIGCTFTVCMPRWHPETVAAD